MEAKYKFISNRITDLRFHENILGKKDVNIKFSVEVDTTIMNSQTESDKFLINFKFNIKDEDDNFKFKIEIANMIHFIIEKREDFDETFSKLCLPDLLGRSRKMIKDITTIMNVQPLELPPFEDEMS
ncbi:hypothetical protein JMF89_04065 [Clostridiaceae bacterium UIB06]|uniref:Preprotein translocase subunit SecB n=1 Tax=Clostridium thailandense TaxID=2794346 RepID=A0A949WPQ1_9CLOT|nr:hypothetical protein [Clostridium thailandense]MBV7271641.1 hypothetical protein [Clostridium thailandense]MCH5136389.1 hypothetical protein [Clostridiaceae bacterium UIB06]